MGYFAPAAPPTPSPSPRGGGEATVLSAGSVWQILAPPSPLVGEGWGGGAFGPKCPQRLCLAME